VTELSNERHDLARVIVLDPPKIAQVLPIACDLAIVPVVLVAGVVANVAPAQQLPQVLDKLASGLRGQRVLRNGRLQVGLVFDQVKDAVR